jgi:hypothetical protein
MFEKVTWVIAGMAFATATATGQPAYAADGQDDAAKLQVSPHLSAADPRDWRTSVEHKTSSQRQRMADGTRTLSREIERDAGSDHSGENTFATGPSMTH